MTVLLNDSDVSAGSLRHSLAKLRVLASAGRIERSVALSPEKANVASLLMAAGFVVEATSIAPNAPTLADSWGEHGLSITVIVASYNYARFLHEAVDSVLGQSLKPDVILLTDDGSTDESAQYMKNYADTVSGIELNVNARQMGIVDHFNHAVSLTDTDVVCFLGADNRLAPTYIEDALTQLVADPDAAVAYTDFVFFGDRAREAYVALDPSMRGDAPGNGLYLSNFPEFTEESRELQRKRNFIHGSSLYRRIAFDRVGGYPTRTEGAEDSGMFRRILADGSLAVKSSRALLEYRQHSEEQANFQFSFYGELENLRRLTVDQNAAITYQAARIAELEQQVAVLNSRPMGLRAALKDAIRRRIGRS